MQQGYFYNGEVMGEWNVYMKKISGFGLYKICMNEIILSICYMFFEKLVKVKGIIICSSLLDEGDCYNLEYNFLFDEEFLNMLEFYEFYVEKFEEGLELFGENVYSYLGQEIEENYCFNFEDFNFEMDFLVEIGDIFFLEVFLVEIYYIGRKCYICNDLIDLFGYFI